MGSEMCIRDRGSMKARFKTLIPPWTYCLQGPKCVYDHCEWDSANMKRALRLRQEARDRAAIGAAEVAPDEGMEAQPPPQEEAPPTTPGKATYAAAARCLNIQHELTPPPRHHQKEHQITRRKRRRLIELRRDTTDTTPTREIEKKPNEEFDSSLGYPGEGHRPKNRLRVATLNVAGLNDTNNVKFGRMMKWIRETELDVLCLSLIHI